MFANWWNNIKGKTDTPEQGADTVTVNGRLHLSPKGAQKVIDNLDSLDILLFAGKGYWFSYFVETVTWSEFSHIGIVLKSPTYLSPKLTGNYLLESGAEKIRDAEDHKVKWGVQITDLREILEGYNGRIYYRKLNCPEIRKAHASTEARMRAIHDVIHNKPYDAYLVDLTRTEFDLNIGDCQRTGRFICSALVGYVYTELGLLPAGTEWDLDTPKAFGPGREIEKKLLRGARFGDLKRVL